MRTACSLALAALAALANFAPTVLAQNAEQLQISAFAISLGTTATGASAMVDMQITNWSTAAERARLIDTMIQKGPDAALRELQKLPVKGRFRLPSLMGPDPSQLRLGHDIRYAFQTPLEDGGRRIIVITDRYIGFREARNQPRTVDYPFTLMELRVNARGEGTGKASVATRITFDKKNQKIELENWSSEPVRLNEVKVSPKK
ncbi:hypothetical protein TBR22_A47690 [Luteitalea sp. TBR-22]|uniref:hypothetical protein n=1 Tax=Luteitalea sp. TBR-22 TaxID=2802971 RepID=UPI001AF50CD9|nr:hypothetical protein [Luteitalea sp. TBR-22]BCS35536.1 hypothetical protein TBR22_A47690 [Luteitalea sp. TBR-22]